MDFGDCAVIVFNCAKILLVMEGEGRQYNKGTEIQFVRQASQFQLRKGQLEALSALLFAVSLLGRDFM